METRKENFTIENRRTQNNQDVIEYFLVKLGRVDDELNVARAELREVMEDIATKNCKIKSLREKLAHLLKEETNRKMKGLENSKAELNSQINRANKVLDGLGLTWVGENQTDAKRDPMTCCTSMNENYYSLKRIPPLRQDINRALGSYKIKYEPKSVPVVPFSGKGYRLGTGSEIFEQVPESLPRQEFTCVEKPLENPSILLNEVVQRTRRCAARARISGHTRTVPVEESPARLGETHYQKSSIVEATKNETDQPTFKDLELEKLPVEFLLMSRHKRRQALKQMSVQIQKNMNKHFYQDALTRTSL